VTYRVETSRSNTGAPHSVSVAVLLLVAVQPVQLVSQLVSQESEQALVQEDVQLLTQASSQECEQSAVQADVQLLTQAVSQELPQLLEQPFEQLAVQPHQHPAACAGFGLTIPRPKKAAADPTSAFFEESSRNLRRVTFLFSFSMIISFTLGHEKPF
jgi:hypothetical protein